MPKITATFDEWWSILDLFDENKMLVKVLSEYEGATRAAMKKIDSLMKRKRK